MDFFVLAVETAGWKTLWLPTIGAAAAAGVQLSRKVIPKIPPAFLPVYSALIGVGLSYLGQYFGVMLPADPLITGIAAGTGASAAVKGGKDGTGAKAAD